MNFNASFQQILAEKMQTQTSKLEESNSSISPLETDPVHLAFLLGRVDRFSFTPGRARKSYPRPSPRPRPAHTMNMAQKASFEYLKSFDCCLSENFNLRELKAAFRAGALKTHPDQGGQVFEFIELKNHYASLLSLVSMGSRCTP